MAQSLKEQSSGRQILLHRSKHRAIACLSEQEFGRAFAHFLIALTVEPSVKGEIMNAFLFTLDKLSEKLEHEGKLNDVLMCYEQALEVLPHESSILHGLATVLYRCGYFQSAASYFLKSYQESPFFTPSLYCMENLKNALVERWHFVMLNDRRRNLSYFNAIKKAVSSGFNTVLDIGAGTGILSMMAFDAGAKNIYACEASEMMFVVLETVLKANNKDVKVFPLHSTDLSVPDDFPERVSLIVTEIFDAGLFGEHCLSTLNHAWKHLLQKPESEKIDPSDFEIIDERKDNECHLKNETVSKIIPSGGLVFAVPLECERIRTYVRLHNDVQNAFELSEFPIVPIALDEEPYGSEKILNIPGGFKKLSEPYELLEVNFNSTENIESLLEGQSISATFICHTGGKLDAIAVWFNLNLDEEITISTAPEEDGCWEQAIFPICPYHVTNSSLHITAGDTIEANFYCKGHLTLQKVTTTKKIEASNQMKCLSFDTSLIHLLNTYSCGNAILVNSSFKMIFEKPAPEVIDVSTFPLLGLKLLKEGANSVTVLKSQYHREIMDLQDYCKLSSEKLLFKSFEELYSSQMKCDYIIVDPVDLSGLLKKNVLEDVDMLRRQCSGDAIVVPGEIEIYIELIDSQSLFEQSKVVSDDRTADYIISKIINAYQCRIHQDIQGSTLNCKRLSKPLKLCNIALNKQSEDRSNNSMQGNIDVEVVCDGNITAILFWFVLRYSQNIEVNTADPQTLWKQAACVMANEVAVVASQKICLQWSCRNSCFDINIKDSKVCPES